MVKRPNVLFLMSDEHRPDVTGYEGNPVIRTPTLDWLAQSGVTFRNAYTPSPICVPGRQCLMAGQLPKTAGCEGWVDLPPQSLTFARRFAQYGYSTIAAGKLHHQGADMMQGWQVRVGNEMRSNHNPGAVPEELARFARPFGSYKWNDAKEIKRAGVGQGICRQHDDYAVQGALLEIERHFLDPWYDRECAQQPLLLKVSLLQPHYPYLTSEELFKYYLGRVQPYLEACDTDHPFLSRRQVRVGQDASERELRRATAAYYGMVETVDQQFARVLTALREAGQDLDDWLIIYTSDHGEMLGQHGIWEKQKFYEASVRVPLLIRWPKAFAGGRVVHENVSLCDLYATLCDLAGLPVPEGLDSRSLRPLLQGQASGWDNEAVSQFGQHNLMIKRDLLKYHYYGAEMPEVLWDLASDPGETRNLVDEPTYATALAAFRRRRAALGHGPDAPTPYRNAGYLPGCATAGPTGQANP